MTRKDFSHENPNDKLLKNHSRNSVLYLLVFPIVTLRHLCWLHKWFLNKTWGNVALILHIPFGLSSDPMTVSSFAIRRKTHSRAHFIILILNLRNRLQGEDLAQVRWLGIARFLTKTHVSRFTSIMLSFPPFYKIFKTFIQCWKLSYWPFFIFLPPETPLQSKASWNLQSMSKLRGVVVCWSWLCSHEPKEPVSSHFHVQ